MDKLPIYEMVIDENPASDIEVSFIALVDKPAIEKNFMAFRDVTGEFVVPKEGEDKDVFLSRCISVLIGEGKEQDQAVAICSSIWDNRKFCSQLNFLADGDRQIISGPAMVPDTLIYRKDENGEYNVFFSKETISDIALKFFKKDYQKNINLFHDPNLSVQGVTVFESFVSDKSRGIQPMKGFEDLPDGTWFISAKVENPEVWNKIKDGTVKGYSVEGYFSTRKVKKKTPYQEIFEIINATLPENLHLKENEDTMSKLKDLVAAFKQKFDIPAPIVPPAAPATDPVNKFADYMTKDGKAVTIDKMEVGGIMQMDGQPCPAGEYELQDGTKVTVGEGGVISAVTPVQMATQITMEQVNEAITKALEAYKLASQTQLTAYQNKLSAAETAVTNQNTTIRELFVIVEKLAEIPTAEPIESTRQQFLKEKEQTREERFKQLQENLSKLKKVS